MPRFTTMGRLVLDTSDCAGAKWTSYPAVSETGAVLLAALFNAADGDNPFPCTHRYVRADNGRCFKCGGV